ncbi:MAG: SHOCT domain-containing protein [Bacillota bacterium]|nr:SHOCT domain-containing protein [Bacillota bacterium]
MKKYIITMILTIFVVMSFSGLTLAAEMELKSIDAILSEIRQEQGISSTETIDVDKVSADKLEELGDSVMEVMIGNTEMHEQMDERLGGEGSTSLTAFHKRLGYNYLTGNPDGMMNTYQGGMMGFFGRGGMMGYGWDYGWILILLGGLVIIGIIGAIIYVLVRAANVSGKSGSAAPREIRYDSNSRALAVLAERYARGEISDEEYKQKKSEIIKP